MIQKKIILFAFLLFFAILFLNNISAVNSCTIENTFGDCTGTGGVANGHVVAYLSDSTNAHGELRNVESRQYSKVLCCNFGPDSATYSTICSSTVIKAIGLSDSTNAHGEGTLETTYTGNNVCSNSFQYCIGNSGSSTCATLGGTMNPSKTLIEILRLSSSSNAHLAAEGTAIYPTKICCAVSTAAAPAPTTCTTDAQCTTSPNLKCKTPDNVCVQCLDNSNCDGSTPVCNTATNQCVSPPICSASNPTGTCPIGQTCVSGTCTATPTQCNDGIDNDDPEDTLIDLADPGCSDESDNNEVDGVACSIDRAYWENGGEEISSDLRTNNLVEGNPINLVVLGTDCVGLDVSFEVLENDIALNTGDAITNTEPSDITFISSTGASNSRAMSTWTTEYQDDPGDSAEYKFIATVTDASGNVIGTINSRKALGDPRGGDLLHVFPGYQGQACESIHVCLDYPNTETGIYSCNSDGETGNNCHASLYSVPNDLSGNPIVDCDNPLIECKCRWDDITTDGDGIGCEFTSTDWSSSSSSTYTYCGDGIITAPNTEQIPIWERCDPGGTPPSASINLGLPEMTCQNYNSIYDLGGTIDCSSGGQVPKCMFDISDCESSYPPVCGDNAVNRIVEQCDGTEFNGWNCQLLRGDGGSLACGASTATDACKIDASGCIPGECRVGYDDCGSGEVCTAGTCVVGDGLCEDQTQCLNTQICAVGHVCVDKGTGGDSVDNSCSIDEDCNPGEEICVEGIDGTKTCVLDGGDPTGFTYCGDNIVQSNGNSLGKYEDCDESIGAATCSSVSSGFYTQGTLSCAFNCQYDISQCRTAAGETPDDLADSGTTCGNGIIDALDEECDPGTSALGDENFGMFGNACSSGIGEMTCDADCTLNTASCTTPPPEGGLGTPIGKCTISTTGDDTCADDNFLTYTWSGVWKDLTTDTEITTCSELEGSITDGDTPAGKCNSCKLGGTSTIACPAQVALPFFNIYNFIITSIAIALFYGIIILRRKGIIRIVD